MSHADGGSAHLVRMRAAQLQNRFVDLTKSGRAHGVAFSEKATARIDRHVAVDAGAPFGRPTRTLTARNETEILRVDDLRNREAVVEFDEVNVSGSYTGGPECLRCGADGSLERAEIGMSGNSRTSAGLNRRENLDARLPQIALEAIGHQNGRGRTVAHRTAIVQLQRIADERRSLDRLLREIRTHLRQRIGQAVALVLPDYR